MDLQDVWDRDAARGYDTLDAGMFAAWVIGPVVERLAGLAGDGGRALEFAIGTGRIAVPLAERGVPVTGIELSWPMIEQLRAKASEAAIPVVAGDMATARAPGTYALVYVVYNAISYLQTQPEQVACFRNAARHLAPGGRFVVELWVPELRKLPPGQQALAFEAGTGVRHRGHLRRGAASCSSRTTSGSARAVRPGSGVARTVTSGRQNST